MLPFDSTLYATAAARLGWTVMCAIGFRLGGFEGEEEATAPGLGHTLCTTYCAWHVLGYNGMGERMGKEGCVVTPVPNPWLEGGSLALMVVEGRGREMGGGMGDDARREELLEPKFVHETAPFGLAATDALDRDGRRGGGGVFPSPAELVGSYVAIPETCLRREAGMRPWRRPPWDDGMCVPVRCDTPGGTGIHGRLAL